MAADSGAEDGCEPGRSPAALPIQTIQDGQRVIHLLQNAKTILACRMGSPESSTHKCPSMRCENVAESRRDYLRQVCIRRANLLRCLQISGSGNGNSICLSAFRFVRTMSTRF